ncbi:MAG TPA: ABC transporter permease [Balneolales bacterium]|nr:ABC transporter permease [Balneolales bacterium]
MPLLVTLQQFFQDLKAQKLRSSLTITGITWGTVSVVVLLAFGVGLQKQSRKNMHGMGKGIVIVFGNKTTKPFQGYPDGRRIHLRMNDVSIIKKQIPEIKKISAEFRNHNVKVHVGTNITSPTIVGCNSEYSDMRNVIPQEGGRFINRIDMEKRRRVVVLGDEIKGRLFGDKKAVGKQVYVGNSLFTVIGVMKHKVQNSSYGGRDESSLFIPITTYHSLFGDNNLNNIVYQMTNPKIAEQVKTHIRDILGHIHKFDPTDKDAISIWDTNQMDKFLMYFFMGFNIFMGIIGSFTLTVGGIGVANIMFIVVKEKTREIGIKRSVGATSRSIMFQFFFESFLIVAIGAILGMIISVLLVDAVSLLPIKQYVGNPSISPVVLIATITLLMIISLLAGFFPARKAGKLEPVECLRYGM